MAEEIKAETKPVEKKGIRRIWWIIAVIALAWWVVPFRAPVEISYEPGLLSDGVLVIRNKSDRLLNGTMTLYKSDGVDCQTYNIMIHPKETVRYGRLEVFGYAPSVGSRGTARFEGYILTENFSYPSKNSINTH